MKQNFLSRFQSIMLALLTPLIIVLMFTYPADNRKNNDERLLNEAASDVWRAQDSTWEANGDSSFKSAFHRVKDSLWQIVNLRKLTLQGHADLIENIGVGPLRLAKFKEESGDYTALLFKTPGSDSVKEKFYLQIPGFTIRDNSRFYIRDGKNFVISNFMNEDPATKEINIRYTASSEVEGSSILIPVALSSSSFKIWMVIIQVMMAILGVVCLFVIFYLPAKTLYLIAKGDPFNSRNITRLRIIGWGFIVFAIFPVITSLLAWLSFSKSIPHDFYYPVMLIVGENRWLLIGGIAVLLLAAAFKKGNHIQEEQDLTV